MKVNILPFDLTGTVEHLWNSSPGKISSNPPRARNKKSNDSDATEDDDIIMKAEGINMREMWKYLHIVYEKKIWCNDAHQMREHFGVEAACTLIKKARF
jgi:hypothetical protein